MKVTQTQKVVNGQRYTVYNFEIENLTNNTSSSSVSTVLSGSGSSGSTSSSSISSSSSSSTLSNMFTSSSTDGKDDGNIGFLKATGNFLKGILNFGKSLVCDENGNFSLGQTLKTVAIGAAIAGASLLIPGAGTVIALGALGIAGYHGTKAGYNILTAKTDAEAALAWQNMGSAATEVALAYAGAKGTGAFAKGAKAWETVKTGAADLYGGYKTGGYSGLRSVAAGQKASIRSKARSVKDGTVENWGKQGRNYRDTETRLNKYDADIKAAEDVANNSKLSQSVRDNARTRAARLSQERARYNEGVEAAKNATGDGKQFSNISRKVAELKREVSDKKAKMDKAAQEKGTNSPEYKQAKADYETAQAKYKGAQDYLKTQQRNGNINASEAADELKQARENAASELKTKTEAETKAQQDYEANPDNESFKTAYEKAKKDRINAQAALEDAKYQESLMTDELSGVGEARYVISESVKEGFWENPKKNIFLTLSLAGKGYKEAA